MTKYDNNSVGLVVSFLNSTTRTRRLCPRLDQTHGQNPYMSRLNEQVYDQTKSADLSETLANPTGLCRRPGRRPVSPTKSGRVALVEFGYYVAHCCTPELKAIAKSDRDERRSCRGNFRSQPPNFSCEDGILMAYERDVTCIGYFLQHKCPNICAAESIHYYCFS